MPHLAPRPWVPAACESYIQRLATDAAKPSDQVAARLDALIAKNRQIHDQDCFNLNPATNVMNPRAEAALASGLLSAEQFDQWVRPVDMIHPQPA